MIKSIRGRLQWWYGAVYALSIVVFGSLVYWRADRDVHERATLQAVSTAQYLDVSLRKVRPVIVRNPEGFHLDSTPGNNSDAAPDQLPQNFSLGPLPPEFQFRPPRDRDANRRPRPEEIGRPPQNRPMMDEQLAGWPNDMTGPPPPRDGGMRRGPDGPGRRGIPGPETEKGIHGPPDNLVDSIRPPGTDPDDASNDIDRRTSLDRMEFAIWRPDGSLLTQSAGFPSDENSSGPEVEALGPEPSINMSRGHVEVVKRGPAGAVIQVLRTIQHDMANLHRFGFQIAAMAFGTLAVGLMGGWWISGRIVHPIRMISRTADQISATSLNRRIETENLDAELVQLGSVLNRTFERLEQSFSRLTQFTADASHELRTPLAVIQSQAELALSQTRSPEAYQQTLEICLKSSDRMRSLIDGLLLLARTDSDHPGLRPITIDLRNIAEESVRQLQDKAIAAGVELECNTPESEVLVPGDAGFLTQVPVNLIDNAIQHSSSGGKIFVEVRLEENKAVLIVKDNGCGIAAEHVPHLFERFYRVDVGRSRRHGGSGLGLAICKSLVEAHKGTIDCQSSPGHGSTFVVRLPLVQSLL